MPALKESRVITLRMDLSFSHFGSEFCNYGLIVGVVFKGSFDVFLAYGDFFNRLIEAFVEGNIYVFPYWWESFRGGWPKTAYHYFSMIFEV